jgi:protein gp37
MDENWVRDIVKTCRDQNVAVWVKQFGEVWSRENLGHGGHAANIEEFPADLRIQEFPKAEADVAEQGAFAF